MLGPSQKQNGNLPKGNYPSVGSEEVPEQLNILHPRSHTAVNTNSKISEDLY